MCYHISQRQIDLERIFDEWQAEPQFGEDDLPIYWHLNGFSRGKVMVITQDDPDSIQLATWSLLPPNYTREPKEYWDKVGGGSLNLRDWRFFHENPKQNYPPWKNEAVLYHKCLVLVDGIYEPHHPPGGEDPIPFLLQRPDRSMFALLGIYTPQEDYFTSGIITTTADHQFARVHNKAKRMPIFLEPETVSYFLHRDTEEGIKDLFYNYYRDSNEGKNMKLLDIPVHRDINRSKVDSNRPDIVDKVSYPELEKPKDLFD